MKKSYLKMANWFLEPADLTCFVICRITFGFVLFFTYLFRVTSLATFYSSQGIDQIPHAQATDYLLLLPMEVLSHLDSAIILSALCWILILASLSFALGFRTRLSGAITLILHSVFLARACDSYWGWSTIIKPYLLYTILAPSGGMFSRLRGSAWPLRLLQLNVASMYLESGWSRIKSPGWLHGQMLYVALSSHLFRRFDFDWSAFKFVLSILCLASLVLELLAPFLLWVREVGKYWALGLIGMHVMIELLTTVGSWNYVMIAALTAFLPASWLRLPEIWRQKSVPSS